MLGQKHQGWLNHSHPLIFHKLNVSYYTLRCSFSLNNSSERLAAPMRLASKHPRTGGGASIGQLHSIALIDSSSSLLYLPLLIMKPLDSHHHKPMLHGSCREVSGTCPIVAPPPILGCLHILQLPFLTSPKPDN